MSSQLFNKITILQENASEELLAQKQEYGVEIVQKVLDMRGLQVRVLSNLEKLNAKIKAIEEEIETYAQEDNINFSLKWNTHMMVFRFMALELLVPIQIL